MAVSISDPTKPIGLESFGMPMNGRGTWGLDLKGNSIILTYMNALIPFVGTESGLRRINWAITTDAFDFENPQIALEVYLNLAAKELFIAVNDSVRIDNIYLHHNLGISQRFDFSRWQTGRLPGFDIGSFASGLYYFQFSCLMGMKLLFP